MRKLVALVLGLAALSPAAVTAQAAPPPPSANVDLKEWPVEWGGRTRDPYVAPDGKVWFVSQTGDYVARFDPVPGTFKRFEIPAGSLPHNLIVAPDGVVWFSGNGNGTIVKLDPNTGQTKVYTPEPRVGDPHTLVLDGKGNMWFTAQAASRVGRFNMATEKFDIINPLPGRAAGPYGIVLDKDGRPWFNMFATNMIATIDPQTLAVKTYPLATTETRDRRIAMTPDGMLYYTDYARGYLGQLNPTTGATQEWLMPGGARSMPYAVVADDRGRLWVSETGAGGAKLVGFDPASKRFFANTPVSGGIRHMMYDAKTGTMWFGTDAGQIGRVVARTLTP